MTAKRTGTEKGHQGRESEQKISCSIIRQDKEILMRFCWGFGTSERDRYYYYVSLLLIETGMHLQDLLRLTIKQAESIKFRNDYPAIDPEIINWLRKYSRKRNCCYLLAKRCRKSYTYFFRQIMRKSGKVCACRRIVPALKRGGD
jgi:hypothetical protein